MIYLLLARGILAAVRGWEAPGLAASLLQRLTNPVLAAVGSVTPRAVPRFAVLVFAVVWLFAALFALVYGLAILGTRPLWA